MGMRTSEIKLDADGIDYASELASSFLEDAGLDKRSILSARLTFESSLLEMRESLGEVPAEILTGKRLGRPRLIVKVHGPRFDPPETSEETYWERALMVSAGLSPSYAYRGGYNILEISCARGPMGSTQRALLAIVLGIVLARLGLRLPAETRTTILDGLITPLFDTFIAMLSGIAGPMVFFSVAWGICGIGDMAALGRSGKALISKFMTANVLAVLFGLLVGIPVFQLQSGTGAGTGDPLSDFTKMLLDLLPTNIVAPFLESNTLQIIVLSVVVGIAALALGDLTEGVRHALRELNTLIQFLMEQLCRLLPGFIVVMIISSTWSGTMGALLASWLPIVVASAGMAVFLLLILIHTSIRSHVPLHSLIMTCIPTLVLACTTASASAAFATMLATCKDDLGVDEDQASFGVPMGMVLCKPMTPILFAVVMLYGAKSYGVGVDLVWYVRLGVSCLLYSIAVPPVPGGSLACYGMMLTGLGIPSAALAVCTALDMLVDNLCVSGNCGALVAEVLDAAKSLDAVDQTKLDKLGGHAHPNR